MGTVYYRAGSNIWTGAFRAWNAAKQEWMWRYRSTGQTDKAKALGVVAVWEAVALQVKAGTMTREKAMASVNDILRLGGMHVLETTPSLESIADAILHDREISKGTYRKYAGFLDTLKVWAGTKIKSPADSWTADDCVKYYRHMRTQVSISTSNQHLNFLSMLFVRAVALGHRTSNPVEAVERAQNEEVNKGTFSRSDTTKLLRAMRKARRRDWALFTALSWHTGHRIQDLLDTTKASITGDLLTIRPRKKDGKPGAREVVLPLPMWLARALVRLGDFNTIQHADNRNGKVSEDFIAWMERCGIDPRRVQRKKRAVAQVSHHSFRHSMTTRLTSAGVSSDIARMVTDHDSEEVHKRYQHAEIEALRVALRKAR